MPNVVSDIIVTPVTIFYANTGATLPLDTVAAGASWGVGWTTTGFTLEPLTLNYSFEVFEVRIQQSMAVVRRTRQTEEAGFETVLAEHSATNLALALAGEATTTAAGASQPAKQTFTVGGDPNLPVKMWGFEGDYPSETGDRFPIRAYLWRGTAAEGGEVAYDREEVAGIPLNIMCLADTSKPKGQQLLKIDRITAPASS